MKSLAMLAFMVAVGAIMDSAIAALACDRPASFMEHMICADPAIGARDAAMNALYHATPSSPAVLAAQRRWLAGALACHDTRCLEARYDARIGDLLQADDGRRIARRYHLKDHDRNGDLVLVQNGPWITYDAVETVIGPKGAAAGDVNAARLGGTLQLSSGVATDHQPGGCTVMLQHNRDDSWSMATRHCFDGAGADLNARFVPTK